MRYLTYSIDNITYIYNTGIESKFRMLTIYHYLLGLK